MLSNLLPTTFNPTRRIIMGGFNPPAVKPTVQKAPEKDVAAEQAQKNLDNLAKRNARGRSSTILTSGEGLQDAANIARKTLLGQ
jgi:hypothetical protein